MVCRRDRLLVEGAERVVELGGEHARGLTREEGDVVSATLPVGVLVMCGSCPTPLHADAGAEKSD